MGARSSAFTNDEERRRSDCVTAIGRLIVPGTKSSFPSTILPFSLLLPLTLSLSPSGPLLRSRRPVARRRSPPTRCRLGLRAWSGGFSSKRRLRPKRRPPSMTSARMGGRASIRLVLAPLQGRNRHHLAPETAKTDLDTHTHTTHTSHPLPPQREDIQLPQPKQRPFAWRATLSRLRRACSPFPVQPALANSYSSRWLFQPSAALFSPTVMS